MKGWYYLHTNGDLIFKSSLFTPEDFDSPFVKKYWKIDTTNRKDAYDLITEALSLGANVSRVNELIGKWKMTNEDTLIYASYIEIDLYKENSNYCAKKNDVVGCSNISYIYAIAELLKKTNS